MKIVTKQILDDLYKPDKFSHKGQNGKLLIIGGSSLFHGASLWALKTASRVVDMVFYLSTDKNQQYADWLNKQLYDFISIDFDSLDDYVREADAILIGPGMTRSEFQSLRVSEFKLNEKNFENTKGVVDCLLHKYPQKKWVIDAGALQMMEPEWLKDLSEVIITPHLKELGKLFKISKDQLSIFKQNQNPKLQNVTKLLEKYAKDYGCTLGLKGAEDIICSFGKCMVNKTGNEGMTKGGTGDVLAGLIAAFACKSDLFTAAAAGAYVTGLAGDELKQKVGTFFNASDLCDQIPKTLHKLLLSNA